MTDTPDDTGADVADESHTTDPGDEVDEPDDRSASASRADGIGDSSLGDDRSLTEHVQLGLLAILLLVIAIATFQFYFAAGAAVDRFVTRHYRPLFQAGFNLAIVLAAGAGLSVLVRRLS